LTGQAVACFQVEEIFTEQDNLLVLSLGFVSPDDPLDTIHFACGRRRSGASPPSIEDLLYVERTDQSLACDGSEVVRLASYRDRLELILTESGADALGLPAHTLFRFDEHTDLLADATTILLAMRQAGQEQILIDETLR